MPASALSTLRDEELATLITQHNAIAFQILVKRHAQRFYRVAFGIVLNQHDAEDIVQDAFIKLWSGKAQWQQGRNALFTTWFYRIVYHQALDFLRKKPTFSVIADDNTFISSLPNAEECYAETQVNQALEKAIKQLPERQRTALILAYKENLPQIECATIMDLSLKAFESLLNRGKIKLRELLESSL